MTNNFNINELRDRAYECAKAHGWHDTELSDEHLLWLVITELAEATNAHRCNKRAKTEDYNSRMNYFDTQNLEPDVIIMRSKINIVSSLRIHLRMSLQIHVFGC